MVALLEWLAQSRGFALGVAAGYARCFEQLDGAINLLFERLFFFQAEDGIRDTSVTGVQTCALPISCSFVGIAKTLRKCFGLFSSDHSILCPQHCEHFMYGILLLFCIDCKLFQVFVPMRSEERRVGKECRYGWLQAV